MVKRSTAAAILVSLSATYGASYGYCGEVADAIRGIAGITKVQGNAAVGVNTGEGAKIKAEQKGQGGTANAGLAVVDAKDGGGKGVNAAVGVNTAKGLEISAKSDGGTANAGLAVVSSGSGK